MKNFKLRANIGMRILKLLPTQVINSMPADVIEHYKFNVDNLLTEFESKFNEVKPIQLGEEKEEIKVFIDVSPNEEDEVCGNCYHFWRWGVKTGTCCRPKLRGNNNRDEKQTCSLFSFKKV